MSTPMSPTNSPTTSSGAPKSSWLAASRGEEARRRALDRFGGVDAARRACADIDRGVVRAERGARCCSACGRASPSRSDLPRDETPRRDHRDLRTRPRHRRDNHGLLRRRCIARAAAAVPEWFAPHGRRHAQRRREHVRLSSSLADFLDWESRQRSFDAMAEFRRDRRRSSAPPSGTSIRYDDDGGLFRVLGVHALRGRLFHDGDDLRAARP